MKREPSPSVVTVAGIGTITAGDNSADVEHTLGSSPTAVIVTPFESCSSPIEVLQSSIDASRFTVRLVGGISLSEDAKFSWVVL